MIQIWNFFWNTVDYPSHPDGELWIHVNGTRNRTIKFDHENIQGFCEFARRNILKKFDCSDYWPGCGATDCLCHVQDQTELSQLLGLVEGWQNLYYCEWISGEGNVCKARHPDIEPMEDLME